MTKQKKVYLALKREDFSARGKELIWDYLIERYGFPENGYFEVVVKEDD